ncbi:fungal-trans domain-containing protein [Favolaschia claudopus]|uniref:Fungal-trans domain-containing protein n=1 Tax=Favolaschia claudopus TaxID=2862362 RepID=A0AAW0DZW2_9AGAR
MTQEGSSPVSFGSPPSKPKACKCDGERPKCGPCSRSMGFQDCEYAEDGPTRTQVLLEQISILQARIEELETPNLARPVVPLQNPYPGVRRSTSLPVSSAGSTVNLSGGISEDAVGTHLDEALIQTFLKHSCQFGFFLNMRNFNDTVLRPTSPGNIPRPTRFLLAVIDLWAIHLSSSPDDYIRASEGVYLSRALRASVDALAGVSLHHTLIHAIQAEVLLSHYFLRNLRFLEGKYHISSAVSLVLSSGLHRIRSADAFNLALMLPFRRLAQPGLPPPRDTREENERINAFWAVLTLNNGWTAVDGSPSNFSYTGGEADIAARIDTPWPVDIDDDDAAYLKSSMGTVTSFLAGLPDNGTSVTALKVKAMILFEQASRLAAQYREDMLAEQSHQFYNSFNALDALIEQFKITMTISLSSSSSSAHSTHDSRRSRNLFVIHCLVNVATIQLHNPLVFSSRNMGESSRVRVLGAARSIADNIAARAPDIAIGEFGFIDPIVGTLLFATAQVFIAELRRSRANRSIDSIEPIPREERELIGLIESVMGVMNVFAPTCRLMESQLITLQQLFHGL